MKLEDQVCTLEQAVLLKDMGVTQKSQFLWQWEVNPSKHVLTYQGGCYPNCAVFEADCAAFTVAELGMMLPEWIYRSQEEYRRRQWHNTIDQYSEEEKAIGGLKVGYCICYEVCTTHGKRISVGKDEEGIENRFPIEAQARAAMLIYLLENKLATSHEVNGRLVS